MATQSSPTKAERALNRIAASKTPAQWDKEIARIRAEIADAKAEVAAIRASR